MKKHKQRISLLLTLALVISTLFLSKPEEVYAATTYSGYVTNVNVSRTGTKVTVKYTVKSNIPNGATCYIGYEDSQKSIKKEVKVGTKGTHTITWNIGVPVYRIYTKLVARNYTDKDVIKVLNNIKTGTSYHAVTKKEENSSKISSVVASTVVTLAGLGVKGKAATVLITVLGLSFTAVSTFSYAPSAGNYIVTNTSYNAENGNLTTTVRIFNSKNDYKSGTKPAHKWSEKRHIGF